MSFPLGATNLYIYIYINPPFKWLKHEILVGWFKVRFMGILKIATLSFLFHPMKQNNFLHSTFLKIIVFVMT